MTITANQLGQHKIGASLVLLDTGLGLPVCRLVEWKKRIWSLKTDGFLLVKNTSTMAMVHHFREPFQHNNTALTGFFVTKRSKTPWW